MVSASYLNPSIKKPSYLFAGFAGAAGLVAAGLAGVVAAGFGEVVAAGFAVFVVFAAGFVLFGVLALTTVFALAFVFVFVFVFEFDVVFALAFAGGAGRVPLSSFGLSTTFFARKFSIFASFIAIA